MAHFSLLALASLLICSGLAHLPVGNVAYRRPFASGLRAGRISDDLEDRLAVTRPFQARKLAAFKVGKEFSEAVEDAKEDLEPSWHRRRRPGILRPYGVRPLRYRFGGRYYNGGVARRFGGIRYHQNGLWLPRMRHMRYRPYPYYPRYGQGMWRRQAYGLQYRYPRRMPMYRPRLYRHFGYYRGGYGRRPYMHGMYRRRPYMLQRPYYERPHYGLGRYGYHQYQHWGRYSPYASYPLYGMRYRPFRLQRPFPMRFRGYHHIPHWYRQNRRRPYPLGGWYAQYGIMGRRPYYPKRYGGWYGAGGYYRRQFYRPRSFNRPRYHRRYNYYSGFGYGMRDKSFSCVAPRRWMIMNGYGRCL